MSFGDRVFAALAAEREKLGGAIPRSRWVEIVNGLLADREAKKKHPRPKIKRPDPYVEPGPEWRSSASAKFPFDAAGASGQDRYDWNSISWFDIPVTLRREILALPAPKNLTP
jgi:hypothetical protein